MVNLKAATLSTGDVSASDAAALEAEARLRLMFDSHYDFVWRSLRRLGVPESTVDDAAQEVFVIASRKLAAIDTGKERAFLFGTATRVASDARRSLSRRREEAGDPAAAINQAAATDPHPDALVEQKQARAFLDEVVDALADDVRPIFVLFEFEGMTMIEISEYLEIAQGTVASRLRRARRTFRDEVAELKTRLGGSHV